MNIAGIQKLTLLDYPGKVACTVFTYGCDFRCPYCHNASIAVPGRETSGPRTETDLYMKELTDLLDRRKGVLDGVVVTGGEPTLQPDLADLLSMIKAGGYAVKLDTNGSRPDVIRDVMERGLVDRIAMDIKAAPDGYAKAVGLTHVDITAIDESRRIIMESGMDYEFRTTLVKGLHDMDDVEKIAKWIKGAKEYYLQQFKDSGDLIAPAGLDAFDEREMERFADAAAGYVPAVKVRGV